MLRQMSSNQQESNRDSPNSPIAKSKSQETFAFTGVDHAQFYGFKARGNGLSQSDDHQINEMVHQDHEAEPSHIKYQPSIEELKVGAELAGANIPKAGLLRIRPSNCQDYSEGDADRKTDLEFQNRGQNMERLLGRDPHRQA